jgi:hypothetical protein
MADEHKTVHLVHFVIRSFDESPDQSGGNPLRLGRAPWKREGHLARAKMGAQNGDAEK